LSCTVVAVLAGKQAIHDEVTPIGVLAAALSALVWVGFLVVTHRRLRELDRARPEVLAPRRALAAVACVLALAVFGVAVVL
jgi:drug/metabolite transporter (DMT)-like permease